MGLIIRLGIPPLYEASGGTRGYGQIQEVKINNEILYKMEDGVLYISASQEDLNQLFAGNAFPIKEVPLYDIIGQLHRFKDVKEIRPVATSDGRYLLSFRNDGLDDI